ncbi:MAG: SAM-dependent DNA methyltransferase [Alphaproteobacteria bacterium]|nr:SAM-dependent DNA methyltransferase [Alphaproteobacteria bacterium]
MFEQAFKNIDDVLWKEAGCTTELDYTEQTSWMLFLKYLDDLEKDREQKAQLQGKPYSYIIQGQYRWRKWAAPKKKDGITLDHDKALIGKDLIEFVDGKLFPYLEGFRERAEAPDTIEYKIGEIFGEIKNKFRSGYSLRDALELVDGLRFRSQAERHELSQLYEDKIRRMGNAGRNGGEYYTPRPLIRAMVQVVNPQIGERIYDGAAGSCGFLCESFDYLLPKAQSTKDRETLQKRTFYAKEKKSLAYVIGLMNMILHGIEAPNIVHTNTLSDDLRNVQEKDRYEVILANPPFGGKERPEVQQNFPIRTGETAFLFLQHFIKHLKAHGRAGIVIKNTFLSNTDNASVALRKELLENCNLHTVLDMPGGTFQGAGVKTVVLFFEKGAPTRRIWFYQLSPGRNLGKTNPLNDDDMADFIRLQKTKANSINSWSIDAAKIDPGTFDLSVKNPNRKEETELRDPKEILAEIAALDAQSAQLLKQIEAML